VIYNTLNSAYLVCPNDAVVEQILEQWENAGNGYGAVLAEKDLENRVVNEVFSFSCFIRISVFKNKSGLNK